MVELVSQYSRHRVARASALMKGEALGDSRGPVSMHPATDLDRGRFTVSVGRDWADLLTPLNFYRMNVKGFGLDVTVQAGAEVLPGVFIYPQIMATCSLSGKRPRNRDGVYDGPPSLVVEIFGATEPWEELMAQSQALLARAGVLEYIAEAGGELRWFLLDNDEYVRIEPNEEGFIRSVALPGLWFNVDAYWKSEHRRMFNGIVKGIESELLEQYRAVYRP